MIPILPPTPHNILRAAEALRAGKLVGMPTETVYGLAGNAFDPAALARIFEVKRRPFFDPLIVHVGGREEVDTLCRDVPADARLLMDRFWPGPLTLALPKTSRVPDLATAGLSTVAVRMPAHPVARALLREAGIPLAAPSANPFGALSPTTAAHVAGAFTGFDDDIDCILDGGPSGVGVESTVVGWERGEPVLLRAGGLALEALEEALGKSVTSPSPQDASDPEGIPVPQVTPGALPWHYAPRTPLRLIGTGASPDIPARTGPRAGLLWFGSKTPPQPYALSELIENLSVAGDLREAAANLFAALHRLDAAGLEVIHAALVPETGLGRAINERLRKAAAKEG